MPRGPKRDDSKRLEATNLKTKGLTYAAIGKALGISRQRAQQLVEPPREVYEHIRAKAGDLCEICGIHIVTGQLHHKLADGNTVENFNDLDNLQYLCVACHVKQHACPSDKPEPIRTENYSAAAMLGRKGGQSRSEAKIRAARENGKRGGKPKQQVLDSMGNKVLA